MLNQNARMFNPTHRFSVESQSSLKSDPIVSWSNTFSEIVNGLAVSEDKIFAAIGGKLISLKYDGTIDWRFVADSKVYSSPAVVGGCVYIGTQNGNVYALDVVNGEEKWCANIGESSTTSPAVMNDTVYIGCNRGETNSGKVWALGISDGNVQWSFEFDPYQIYNLTDPTVANGLLYISNGNDTIYALDATHGTKQWTFETGSIMESSPAVVNESVYVGSFDENVYALDAKRGSLQWSFETDNGSYSSPMVLEDTLFTSSQTSIYALNALNGAERWSFEHKNKSGDRSPVVVDDTVYIAGSDNELWALDVDSGTLQWTFDTNGYMTTLPVVVDNDLYFGTSEGTLYALTGDTEESVSKANKINDTELYTTKTDQGGINTEVFKPCSNCGESLSEYDNPTFCPKCGKRDPV